MPIESMVSTRASSGRAIGFSLFVTTGIVLGFVQAIVGGAESQFSIAPGQVAHVVRHGVQLTQPQSADGAALEIRFQLGVNYPNAEFVPRDHVPWDWRTFGAMALRIRNPGSEPVRFLMRIDDAPDTRNATIHCKTGSATAPPHDTATFLLNFSAGADSMKVHGMRTGPPVLRMAGVIELTGTGSIEPEHVTSFQIFMDRPDKAATLVLEKIRLAAVPPATERYDQIVDKFGQYVRADWPGKIHDEPELRTAAASEARELESKPILADRDRFGGWSAGARFPASGFFTTRKLDGKWWLVDPDGRLFFSTGICTVDFREWGTIVTGRQNMFQWLPPEGDPLAGFFGSLGSVHSGPVSKGKTFSFYAANLYRKYGADYEARWGQTTVARFKSWGFNTIGNWSSDPLEQLHGVPYVATLGVGGDHQRISGGSDYWSTMHDPFDPKFAADCEMSFKGLARRIKDDPWCVGYFVDNELSWSGGPGPEGGRYALAYGALSAARGSAAKAAFVSQLKREYGSVDKLGKAWAVEIHDWEALEEPYQPNSAHPSDTMKQDMAAFVESFAGKYFAVVRASLRKYDPNHLYLGCRFANFTPEEIKAAAQACDVISFNVYQPKLAEAQWRFTRDLDRPCLIGEFHVGATDRGMFHPGLVAASDQKDRAAIYKQYVESVADNPAFVGCHWFDYVDEPLTGRWFDGENYEIGFVTVTDVPYSEMVVAARQVNGQVYSRRVAAKRAGGGSQ